MKRFTLLICLLAVGWRCLAVPVSVAESPLLEIDTGGRVPAVSSAVTGDLVLNTRGGAAGSLNSAFLTIDTRGAGSLNVPVKTVDGLGANLPGVTITARQNGVVVATATTDSFGSASLAGLFAGYYELRAEKSGHLTQLRQHLRVPEDLPDVLAFSMPSPAAPPRLQASDDLPLASLLDKPVPAPIGRLKVFRGGPGGDFVNYSPPTVALDSSRMTIVLTHGCDSSAGAWPRDMARRLAAVPGLTAKANIVAWDWQEAAAVGTPGIVVTLGAICVYPRQFTPEQGLALGQTLWNALGGDYSRPVHFLGHSLGTLVNCATANYLHGDDSTNRVPQKWEPRRTHMTLFDHAGLAPDFRHAPDPVPWALPIPVKAAYVDSYLTTVGVYLETGVNVFLQRSRYLNPARLHGYPYEWYQQSIENPRGSEFGFRQSFEVLGDNATFPVPGGYPEGSVFAQDEATTASALDLVNLDVPEGLAARTAIELVTRLPFGGLGLTYALNATRFGVETTTYVVDAVGTAAVAGTRKVGHVSIGFVETVLDHYGGSLNPLDDPVYGVGGTTPAVLDIPGYADASTPVPVLSLQFILQTRPGGSGPGPQGQRSLQAGSSPANTPAYVWLPVHVPADAVAVAFDFTLSGEGAGDRVVAGVNNTNVFSLAARFIANDRPMSSGSLPVEAWAGQDVELFFGLAGGTSTDARLTIEGIRFLSLPVPVLRARSIEAGIVLEWTEASPGFVLEWTAGLSPTPIWTPIPEVGGYAGQRSLTNQVPAQQGFYRLRRP